MASIQPVSSRSLSEKLLQLVQHLQQKGISNQAYLINNVQVVWVASEKKIYYGPERKEASGETMHDAAVAAGLV